MVCVLVLLPVSLLLQESLIDILVLFLFGYQGYLHLFYRFDVIVYLLSQQGRGLLQLDDRLVLLLLQLKEVYPHLLFLLYCLLQAHRLPIELVLKESLPLMQVVVLLLELPDLEPESIDFLHHFDLAIAVRVEIDLKLLILLQDTVIQDLYFILVVPLQLVELYRPIALVVLRLIGYLLQQRLVRRLHLLLLMQDILQLIDERAYFLRIGGLGGGEGVLEALLVFEHLAHHDLELAPEVGVVLA